MTSLHDHQVYVVKYGRTLDVKDSPVPDVISVGLAQLSHGKGTNPIAEFNEQFNNLRIRRKLSPIDDLDNLDPEIFLSSGAAKTLQATTAPSITVHPDTIPDHTPSSPTPSIDSTASGYYEDLELEEMLITSPTLLRQNEDDVALDMDDWDLDEPEPSDDESTEGNSGEEDEVFED